MTEKESGTGPKEINFNARLVEALGVVGTYVALERLVTEALGEEIADEVLCRYRGTMISNWSDSSLEAKRTVKALRRKCKKEGIDVSSQSLIAAYERVQQEDFSRHKEMEEVSIFEREARKAEAMAFTEDLVRRIQRETGQSEQAIRDRLEEVGKRAQEDWDKLRNQAGPKEGKVLPFKRP